MTPAKFSRSSRTLNGGASNIVAAKANAMLLAALAWTMCFFVVESAVAEVGACGLETGIWAAPEEACQYAGRPEEAAKRFGKDALLEWRLGHYRFEGANCTIFSDKLAAKQCTLRVECSYRGV